MVLHPECDDYNDDIEASRVQICDIKVESGTVPPNILTKVSKEPSSWQKQKTGLLLGTIAVLLFSPDAVVVKIGLEHDITPFQVAYLKYFPCVLVLALVSLGSFILTKVKSADSTINPISKETSIDVSVRLKYILIGSLACCLTNICFTLAFSYATAAAVLSVSALSPVWASLGAKYILGEKLAKITTFACVAVVLGIIVSSSGYFLFDEKDENESLYTILLGIGLGLGAGISVAAYALILRYAYTRYPGINMTSTPIIGLGFSGILAFIVSYFIQRPGLNFEGDLFGTLVVGIDGLLLLPPAFLCYTSAPKFIDPAVVGVLMQLEAVFGPLLAFFIINEKAKITTIVGGSIIILTVIAHEIARMPSMKRTWIGQFG